MHTNQLLIEHFYRCFQQLDWKGMQECYHDEAVFYDPVFQNLNSVEVKAMWEMLCKQAKDLEISFSNVAGDEEYGSCHWKADYTFSKTGRKVVNSIKAHFKFHEGKIIEHMDDFSLWNWSRQALGVSGLILGWSSVVKKKIRAMAMTNLQKFMSKN